MAKGNPPVGRVKAKFADGREQTFKTHTGDTMKHKLRTVATIWDDGRGKSMTFEGDLGKLIAKHLGAKEGEKIFFNLYLDDAPKSGNKGANDDSDWG